MQISLKFVNKNPTLIGLDNGLVLNRQDIISTNGGQVYRYTRHKVSTNLTYVCRNPFYAIH